jgi:hypothetical protein
MAANGDEASMAVLKFMIFSEDFEAFSGLVQTIEGSKLRVKSPSIQLSDRSCRGELRTGLGEFEVGGWRLGGCTLWEYANLSVSCGRRNGLGRFLEWAGTEETMGTKTLAQRYKGMLRSLGEEGVFFFRSAGSVVLFELPRKPICLFLCRP